MNEQLKIIISAEIDKLKKAVKNGTRIIDTFGKDAEEALSQVNDTMGKVGDVSKKTLAIMGGAIVGATTALLALGASTREYRQQQAMLNTAFTTAGGSAKSAKETYNDLYRVLGDGGKATEAAQHLAKLTTNEKHLAEWTDICQGVYATFGESLPIESLTEAVNHSAKLGEVQGSLADALEWSGVSVDEFNEQLFWCNSESEREKLIRDTLNGIYEDASVSYEKTNAQILAQNEAQTKLTDAMALVGETIDPINTMLKELGAEILTDLAPYIEDFAQNHLPGIRDALSGVGEKVGNILSWIADNWEIISTLAIVIAGISAVLTVFSTVMAIVNAVMMASPITWIILAIVAAIALLTAGIILVIKNWDDIKAATKRCWDAIVNAIKAAIDWIVNLFKTIIAWVKENWQGLLLLLVNPFAGAFKLLYDNCEGFRNTINNLFNAIKTIFTNIVNTIKEKFNAAADKIKSIIDKIKGFFKFEWSLPKLKVPKFSITPAGWKVGDLLKGSIPKLGITWNARGGVFDRPTLFNYGNSLQGIGENGAEAVVPLENNLEWLDKLASMLSDRLGTNQPIVLQVDGTTFAKTAVSTINNLTRQTGKLALNVM